MDRFTKIIKPNKIFMGEKDFQQLCLVKKYIEKRYKSKIISCKTIRDRNKLVLSSRNLLLKKKELIKAGKITQNVFNIKKKLIKTTNKNKELTILKNRIAKLYDIKIEYFELRNKFNLRITNKLKDSKIFISYYLNKVRLIDNI